MLVLVTVEGVLGRDLVLHAMHILAKYDESVDVLTVWVSSWVLVCRAVWASRCRLLVLIPALRLVPVLSASSQVAQDWLHLWTGQE